LAKVFDRLATLDQHGNPALTAAQHSIHPTYGGLVAYHSRQSPLVGTAVEGSFGRLQGSPCTGAQCQDAFFKHHATTYYSLMQAQFQQA
jgi:hypothetical protein